MSSSPSVRKARKSLLALAVLIVALVGVIGIGVFRGETGWAPKLALDLQGGTQILLAPKQTDGSQVTGEQLYQAVSIIRQRVNANGVTEAEITTQGNQNIVVSIPGKADETTLNRIEASAKMDMRAVLYYGPATSAPAETEDSGVTDIGEASDTEVSDAEAATPGDEPADAEAAEQPADDSAVNENGDGDDAATGLYPDPLPTNPSDAAWLTEELFTQFTEFTCDSDALEAASTAELDRPLVTCDTTGTVKYILSPVEQNADGDVLSGESIRDATSGQTVDVNGAPTGGWSVNLRLDETGTQLFGQMSTRLNAFRDAGQSPLDQFAFVLDGAVLVAPQMQVAILDGRPSISGNYTQETAQELADQLKFGALPIGFTVQSQQDISATLGTSQLQWGLLTGLIGFILVMIYSFFQYRVLGTVTVFSLLVAGLVTYLLLTYMSWRHGYRLSLAGIAGVMVAVGFTADSFIVYFERIRDELRDGREISAGVEAGWKRAIRTILASDGINFLAAVILFLMAIGNVQGFAFTLGLTTLVDILIVMLFTHPLLTLLSRTKFYREGHPASGLDPRQLGAVYRGRAQFRAPVITDRGSGRKNQKSRKEAERRQTIAERKAAETQGAK